MRALSRCRAAQGKEGKASGNEGRLRATGFGLRGERGGLVEQGSVYEGQRQAADFGGLAAGNFHGAERELTLAGGQLDRAE